MVRTTHVSNEFPWSQRCSSHWGSTVFASVAIYSQTKPLIRPRGCAGISESSVWCIRTVWSRTYKHLTIVDWIESPTLLEESNFNFRYVRLWDLNFPREKWLYYMQKWRPWSDAAFCGVWSGFALFASYPFYGFPDYNVLIEDLELEVWTSCLIYIYIPTVRVCYKSLFVGPAFFSLNSSTC